MTRIRRIDADFNLRTNKSASIRLIRVIRVPIEAPATEPQAPSRHEKLYLCVLL
ncbi:hypothetical protein Halhy_0694 [Haliscomenobacter hydrossis DSM 1100]|uniref:Uncharacterized protein n=1 Tax=Haliscomenobacter hydrossis (strain ATCC 27775 / DSM 1100 / LMG 10767 / O) TaxID=760192 RepID=F4L2N8_HALH1|nr:hypothetical protein Halhy_0694 [Haliscomenobacter hydrossis DSM 1100]